MRTAGDARQEARGRRGHRGRGTAGVGSKPGWWACDAPACVCVIFVATLRKYPPCTAVAGGHMRKSVLASKLGVSQ